MFGGPVVVASPFFFLFLFQNYSFFPEGKHFLLHQTMDHTRARLLDCVFVPFSFLIEKRDATKEH